MGYYIQGPTLGKAEAIIRQYNALQMSPEEALKALKAGSGVVCVVENGMFDAAAFCYDEEEFDAFNDPHDLRPKTWLVMNLKKAKELSEFNR